MSSGGICAFNAAWERPDAFGKVVSHCGSFTNIRGGGVYPSLIRRSTPRPIRVFLQGGAADLDRDYGNWPVANHDMASALRFRGYDYRFEFGRGAHDLKHGAAIFPETLRWIWREGAAA
jgi:enterochelin esterase family protein